MFLHFLVPDVSNLYLNSKYSFRMAKTIIDAVLGLSFDDSASNLAAATLFYILTGDVSDFAL